MTLDIYQCLRLTLQHIAELEQRFLGSSVEVGFVGSEKDTSVEWHFHGSETIGVGHFLHLCVLHGSSLSLHLIHVLANECASACTHGSTDSGSDNGALGVVSDDLTDCSSQSSATASSEQTTCTSIGSTSENQHCTHNECHKFHFFHNCNFIIRWMIKNFFTNLCKNTK